MDLFRQRIIRSYRQSPCLFLDCDGVIFDSNGFKLEALRHTLRDYPSPALAEMEAYWTANGGVSRYEKLAHFFREVVKIDDVNAHVGEAAARFGSFARRAYDPVAPIAEALQVARHAGRERCFVVSGADQGELRDVFASKGISGLFAQICGSPVSKRAHVERILRERQCAAPDALLIGDGAGDFAVCRALGVPFLYLDQYSEWAAAKATLRGVPDVELFDSWPALLAYLGVTEAVSAAADPARNSGPSI